MSQTLSKGVAVALVYFACLELGGCAMAGGHRQQMAQKAEERFAAADANHDGYLSRDEAQSGMPRIAEHFDDIDADHDRQLSKAEILAYLKQRRTAH